MPLLDAYIPEGALTPEAEDALLVRLTDLLLEHEGVDPGNQRGRHLAWVFVHRPQVYVAGARPKSPRYRFICQVPEGQYNDERRAAVTAEMTRAVAVAEDGAWPHPEFRVAVFTCEVPEGWWGGGGRILRLADIYEHAWPPKPGVQGEPRETAEQVLAERRREEADRLLAVTGARPTRHRPRDEESLRGRSSAVMESPKGPPHGTPGLAREVPLPRAARTLSTLSRVDYTDACLAATPLAAERTGEQWVRAILEGAPAKTRVALRRGWSDFGVCLGRTCDDRFVLGWEVRRSTPQFALLTSSSRLGAETEVLCKRQRDSLLVATFMKLDTANARAVWAAAAQGHRDMLCHLLEQAIRRADRELGVKERDR